MKKKLICAALILLFSGSLFAQYYPSENVQALAGKDTFDVSVIISGFMDMTHDRESLRRELENAIILNLRRDGIRVDSSSLDELWFNFTFVRSGQMIFYQVDIDYYVWSSQGLRPLLWTAGYFGRVGASNFNAREWALDATDTFLSTWFEVNQPSRR